MEISETYNFELSTDEKTKQGFNEILYDVFFVKDKYKNDLKKLQLFK